MACQASLWSLMFVALATVVGVSFFVQVASFTQMGARLTGRLQKVTFRGKRKKILCFVFKCVVCIGSVRFGSVLVICHGL